LRLIASSGSKVPGLRKKVMVDIDELTNISDEFERNMPKSIQESDEILRQKESILSLAHMEAQRIKSVSEREVSEMTLAAKVEREVKVGESEILKAATAEGEELKEEAMSEAQSIIKDAQRKAYRIINDAETSAMTRRDGADQYSREVLFNLEEQLSESLGQVRRGIDALRSGVDDKVLENGNNKIPTG
jgi:vacuolar-type H+-ATPase subunit H